MGLSRIFTSKICLFLATFALISTPALAQLAVNTNALTFAWTATTSLPPSQSVQVTGADSFTPALIGERANLFLAEKSGSLVYVGLNGTTVQSVLNNTYTATLRIQAGAEIKDVTLTLIKGGSFTLGLSQSTIYMNAPAGSTLPLSQPITITPSPAMQIGYTTSVSVNTPVTWLSVSPASGNIAATGTAISIVANPSGLANGPYTGTVSVSAGGATAQITVSLTVGSAGGTVSVDRGAMSFAYAAGSGLIPAAQPLTVYAPAATQVSALASTDSGTSWLLVNGYTTGVISLGAGQSASLSISVNPVNLTAGAHTGRITVAADGISQAVVQVTLNVNSNTGVTVSSTTLAFSSPSGTTAQSVSVLYSGTETGLTYTATPTSTGWLLVTPTAGAVNTAFFVSVNATNLLAGNYTGYVTVSVPGVSFTQTISVTLTVGGGGTGTAFGVGPTSLTFNAQTGGVVSAQPIAVYGPASQTFTATVLSGAQWLSLDSTTGLVPATLSVSVNPTAAGAGVHSGSIQVNSSQGGSAIVQVTLNVQANPVLVATPGGVVINYDPSTSTLQPQYINLSSSAPGTTHFTYTATGTSWVGIYPSAGSTDSIDPRILIVPSVSSLTSGVNSGSVTVTGTPRNGGAQTTLVIPVTVVVTGTGLLTFSPQAVAFTANQGVAPAAQSVTVSSTTSASFSVTATTDDGAGWLLVTPASGITPATLSVSANSAALAAGSYTGRVNVTAAGITQQIPVTLTVGAVAAAVLSLDNVALNFDYQQGGAVPAAKSLQVTSSGSQITINAAATVSGAVNWLSVSPGSASTPAALSISVNPAALTPGDYSGTITVTSSSASNSPQTRTVTLKVRSAPVLSLGVNTMTFTSREGVAPGTQTFSVSSSGDPISFNVSATNAPWLTVSPASGTTPATLSVSVSPAALAPRTYTGQIVVEGAAGNASRQTLDVTLVVTGQLPTITGITNAASYSQGAVAPGELVVIFGTFMGPNELVTLKLDGAGRVSKNLSDVRVLFSGAEAPVVYASASQVSAVVPYIMAGRATTSVQVEYRGMRSNSMTLDVATTAPGIFTLNSSGTGAGAVLNQDFSVNSSGNAAARGSMIIVYATGEGQTIPLGVDGRVNNDPLPAPVLPVTATIDGRPATVHYAGAAPGFVSGVMQLNIEVPATSGAGNVPLVINAGGVSSQANVTVAVR